MKQGRAYSLLTVKSLDEDERVIRGVATTPTPDRMDDIVEPLGVAFKNPMPLLHQHQHTSPVGTVEFDEPTEEGITFTARLPTIEEAGPLKDRVDTAWQEVKAGLVRAVSIGFRALEWAWMDNGGIRFSKSEVIELSLVTVPANADATISVIRSIDRESRGEKLRHVNLDTTKERKKMTTAEQIAALEAKRAANMSRMGDIMKAAGDEGRSSNDTEQEEYDSLSDEVDIIDGDLKRLRGLQQRAIETAKPVTGATEKAGTASRGGASVVQVRQPKLAPGVGLARIAKCVALSRIGSQSGRAGAEPPQEIARSMYGENSEAYGFFVRAPVAAGTTQDDTWAGPLVGEETSAFADFVEFLRPTTILGQFGQGGIPSLRNVPFRVPLIGQTSGGSGYWVGEGKAKPLTRFDFQRQTLEPLKVANIAVLTMEVVRDSSPSADMIIRDQIAAALRERLDLDFIDPAKSDAPNISPASITNGITPLVSSGNDADAIRNDVERLFGEFIAANNAPTSGVWIMPMTVALAISLMRNPLGQREFEGITMRGGTFEGLPVITSQYVPTTTDGSMVALVQAQDIYLADDSGVSVDVSMEASLEMDDNPSHDSDTPAQTQLVSLWQTNSVGFRAERTVNWRRRRDSAVALLSGVTWGAASES